MQKAQKIESVKIIEEELKKAKSTILVDYSGLDVATQQELKKKLKEENARMIVIKNTLLKIAGGKSKLPKEALTDSVLSGQIALVLADGDPISPLKVLAEFAKEFSVPQMKVGIVEGSFQDKQSLEELSKLPGKDGLKLQVLGVMAAPIYGMVGVLNTDLLKLISILDQKAKKGGDN